VNTRAPNTETVRWNDDQDVVRPANKPITATGGVVGLRGNLAPEGAIVKVAGMPLDKQVFREGHALAEVAENYELVAALTERFVA